MSEIKAIEGLDVLVVRSLEIMKIGKEDKPKIGIPE